jgi:hypothetical protein
MSNEEVVSIKIGADYFRRCARNEYSNPLPWIWIREALQNSVDANSSKIDINIDSEYITFSDDGNGMTADIILNKLLTLGGTYKNTENATGGFGKAKEVLFFAWEEWVIKSSSTTKERLIVSSDMIGKEAIRKETGIFNKGTEIKIKYDNKTFTKSDWVWYIRDFVSTCTTKAGIYLNETKLTTLENRGSKIEYDIATIRINKSKPKDEVYIRLNGITMFKHYVSMGISALVTIELKGKSIEMLSSSRECLQYNYQRTFDGIIQKILVNPKTIADKDENILFVDKYNIRGLEEIKNTIPVHDPSLLNAVSEIMRICNNGNKSMMENLIAEINDMDSEVAEKIKMVINGQYYSKMGYPFVVHRYKNKTPDIDPTSAKAQQILHCWKTITDEVIKTFNVDKEYMVGFTFDPNVKASYLPNDGEKAHILINPTKIKQYADAVALGHYLFQNSTHEIAHIKYEDHNEYFTILWSDYLESMSTNPKKWNQVFVKAKAEASTLIKKGKEN